MSRRRNGFRKERRCFLSNVAFRHIAKEYREKKIGVLDLWKVYEEVSRGEFVESGGKESSGDIFHKCFK